MARYVDIENNIEFIDALAGLLEKCNFKHKQACLAPDCRDCLTRWFAAFNSGHLLPAADVVPVKHGHWIRPVIASERSYKWQCSECSEISCCVYNGGKYNKNCTCKFLYCPNCGAKMDGDLNGS